VWRLGLLLIICFFLNACGGGSSSPAPAAPTSGQSTSNPAPTPEAGGQLKAPIPVDVSHGTSATGIDIAVAGPVASPAPNAQDLGANPTTGRQAASNTGGIIHRGGTMRVILFGPGLNGQMQVRIAGPSDVTVASVSAIQATDNTPGIAFMATASGNAALGARTVFLQNTSGDVTSFTGGLEVVP
jgi:hypothetical protein